MDELIFIVEMKGSQTGYVKDLLITSNQMRLLNQGKACLFNTQLASERKNTHSI